MKTDVDNSCRRCGTCCEKGGPSLHLEDRPLVDAGRIPARCLFTIRRGELARDNVRGTLAPLSEELIKIRGRAGRWTCLFYDNKNRGCSIYDHRPLECRALNCRDTRRIERVYETARLTRRELLSGIDGLWELIEDHEQRCSYAALKLLVDQGAKDGRLTQEKAILKIIRYDIHLRRLTTQKGGVDPEMMDFLFGRPLTDTIGMFHIELVKQGGAHGLVPGPLFSAT